MVDWMGIVRSAFSFWLGTGFGIYLAQNYDVPNLKKLASTGLLIARHLEETYRKPPPPPPPPKSDGNGRRDH